MPADPRRDDAPAAVASVRPIALLALGAAAGVVLAAAGLVGTRAGGGLPAGVVARVNDRTIRAEEYERLTAALASDRREPIGEEQRRHVLDRLIDEELLVQRGLELGLADTDRKLRADLTAAVIASVVAEYEDVDPGDAELHGFYDEHADFFRSPGRLRVRQAFIRVARPAEDAEGLARAREVARRAAEGEDLGALAGALGDPALAPIPDDLLPPAKLRDYLGPTALMSALSLGVGEVTQPVRSGLGYHVVQVLEREDVKVPQFEEMRGEILAAYRRRSGDAALRAYLDHLRERADVVVAPRL